jgi:hypothetical protein
MSGLGVRRDGSYYTRIQWTDSTLNDPVFWVNNLIDDDLERSGGTWAANSSRPVNVVLDFFGERMPVAVIGLYQNVGLPISKVEEMVSEARLYVSDDERCRRLGDLDADPNQVQWRHVLTVYPDKREGFQEFPLETPVEATYVRLEMVRNFADTPEDMPWIETSELKLYPPEGGK